MATATQNYYEITNSLIVLGWFILPMILTVYFLNK